MFKKSLIPWKNKKDDLTVEEERDSLRDLQDEMNGMIDRFFEDPFQIAAFRNDPFRDLTGFEKSFSPRVDVSETDKEFKVSAELPGMDEKDIQVTFGRGRLTISGKKESEKVEEDSQYYRRERSYGSFQRSVALPSEINEEKIDAVFKKGILKITIPKTGSAQTKKISIKQS